MPERPLHAVVLPPSAAAGPFLDAVSAALDGTGPAILPLDPGLPAARLRELLDAFAPDAIQTPEGTQQGPAAPAASPPPSRPGLPPGTAAVIVTSRIDRAAQGGGADRRRAAGLGGQLAGPDRRAARPALAVLLPAFHVAGLQVLVRSLLAGTVPLVSDRVGAEVIAEVAAAEPGAHVSLVPTQLRRLLDAGAPLRELGTILLGGAATGLVDPRRGGRGPRGHHLRDVGDVRRLRVRRAGRWTASGCGSATAG